MLLGFVVVLIGAALLFVVLAMQTTRLNGDPLQAHLVGLINHLVDAGIETRAKTQFIGLAAANFERFEIESFNEKQTRLAHALSFKRKSLAPEQYQELRRFFRALGPQDLVPQYSAASLSSHGHRKPNSEHTIFISYAREDIGRVGVVVQRLREANMNVWWDDNIRVGEAWESELSHQLEQASLVLVLWSPLASVSEWVLREANYGLAEAKLVSVFLRKCRLPEAFAHIQASDLSDWDGSAEDYRFQKLCASLQDQLGERSNPTT